MATIFRWDFLRVVLALAALSVALPVALIGCGGDDSSSPPAATSPMAPASVRETPEPQPTEAAATTGKTPRPQPTQAGAGTTAARESPTLPPTRMEQPAEQGDRTLTVYSGRSQSLVHPLLEAFGEWAGVDIRVKYAWSSSTAATLLEEGDNTPADVVFLEAISKFD